MDSAIDVRPLTMHIGAEIHGVDLTQELSDDDVAAIRAAFVRWKVIFFRDQNLDHAQHVAFARRFGDPTIGHVVYGHVEGYPEIYSVAKHRNTTYYVEEIEITPWTGWHADITAAINPPMGSILRGVTIPAQGGDTLWTNLAAAYDGLSPVMRGIVDGLRGVHRFGAPKNIDTKKEHEDLIASRRMASEHPIVRVHPESGERVLYVSPSYLKSIVGMSPRESRTIQELLWEHVVRPEYTVRFHWRAGDIAFWDNRSTCHLAPRDIFQDDADRQLYRVTLVGDVPVGTDGAASTVLEGEPITAV